MKLVVTVTYKDELLKSLMDEMGIDDVNKLVEVINKLASEIIERAGDTDEAREVIKNNMVCTVEVIND